MAIRIYNIFSIFLKFKFTLIWYFSKKWRRKIQKNQIVYRVYHKKKKKNHLGRKLITIKFWKVTSTLENLRSLEKCDTPRTIFFLTLPWEWSRKCAGGKDEVYNTLPTFSHVFPGENTDYKSFWGEKSSTMVYPVVPCVRATSCIVTVLLSVDERSCLLPNISIIVIRNFRIQTVVKRDHRDSNHNSRDYDN